MAGQLKTVKFAVEGMSCANCEQHIERELRALEGVDQVSASAPLAEVSVRYSPESIGEEAIREAIQRAGYQVSAASVQATGRVRPLYRFLGLLALMAALYLLIRYTVGFNFLPAVSPSTGLGLLFVVGLLTSLHCITMCGGIALSQGLVSQPSPPRRRLGPSLLYNAGRVVSYTLIGGLAGALGSLFSLSSALRGVMPVVAGAFMLFLGVRMLGIIPALSRLRLRLPGAWGRRLSSASSGRGSFVVGLLNGLMPCGPLQTMQVYALGTGSFLAGALSMLVFSLGTVPLLLGFGAVSSLLSAKFNRRLLQASGVLVLVLGLVMLTRGLNLFGVGLTPVPAGRTASAAVARLTEGGQEVRTTVESGRYHPLVVQAGLPVRWTVRVKAGDLNGCNNPLTVPQYGIRRQLVPGDNLIEFTPAEAGTITYTCWMGMISSYIQVVPDLGRFAEGEIAAPSPVQAAPSGFGITGWTVRPYYEHICHK